MSGTRPLPGRAQVRFCHNVIDSHSDSDSGLHITIPIVKLRFRSTIGLPMTQHLTRRGFLANAAVLTAGLGAALRPGLSRAQAADPAPVFQTKLHKALIINRPTEADFQRLKEAGFDGVEGGVISPQEAEKCRASAEKLGMRIH